MIAATEAMPLAVKILFIAVALGVLGFPIWKAHAQRRPPRTRRDPYPIRPVSDKRWRSMHVVDRDENER